MRVVGGRARGMPLRLVPGKGTRPILDRVKTALFDILRPRIEGMRVLDLFAGSGSVGIEALSQGAAHCTFIDLGQQAVATIKQNLLTTGFSDSSVVHKTNALEFPPLDSPVVRADFYRPASIQKHLGGSAEGPGRTARVAGRGRPRAR